ncbi:EAL domain-containing protein, partial [Pseudomonas versuta]
GIVLLAKRLDITIVAEGIETSEERDALLGLGVDLMQGYLFARPDTSRLPLANFS